MGLISRVSSRTYRNTNMLLQLTSLHLLFISFIFAKDFEIDVKPGGEVHKVKERHGPMHCHFTYASDGGTNEAWTMTIEKMTNNRYLCSVLRPSGTSYLYFENLKLMGCKTGCTVVTHEAYDNGGALEKTTFLAEGRTLRPSDEFKNELAKLSI